MRHDGDDLNTDGHSAPSRAEVEAQLARMLRSAVFRSAPEQAALLSNLVTHAMEGDDVTEKSITAEVFPVYVRRVSSFVRVMKNHLRKRLAEYYERAGSDDLVLVELPAKPRRKGYRPSPGEAYRPVFTYNLRNAISREHRRGLYYLAQSSLTDDQIAMEHFGGVIEMEPGFAPAHLGKAEVSLRWALYCRSHAPPRNDLNHAESSARDALRCNPELWKARSIIGAISACQHQWEAADDAFSDALATDDFHTRHGAWYYAAYLLAMGKNGEALRLVETRAAGFPDDPSAQIVYGVFLYVTRRFDEAFVAFTNAAAMQPRAWFADFMRAHCFLAEGDGDAAFASVLVAHHKLTEELFPGLLILCVCRAGNFERGRAELAQLEAASGKRYVDSLQLALAYMGVGETVKAVATLSRSCEENDPLMAWLHIWPLFDPLQTDPGFESLVRRVCPLQSSED